MIPGGLSSFLQTRARMKGKIKIAKLKIFRIINNLTGIKGA
jgi:hypothetical protein